MNEALESSISGLLSSSYSTSSDNRIHFPPSPLTSEISLSPNVAKVMQLFKKHQDGTLEGWTEIPFNADDYEELKMFLKKHGNIFRYINDKVRYENYLAFCL